MSEKETKEKHRKLKIQIRPAAYFAMVAMLFFAVGFVVNDIYFTGNVVSEMPGKIDKNIVASDVLGIINKNMQLRGSPNTASLVSVVEESGLYKITISIGGQEIPVYATQDGKYYIDAAYPIDEIKKQLDAASAAQSPETPKKDRPEAHVFVMSLCPFGLQFLKAYIPVIELLGDKADLQVNFVHYAMHGKKEIDENTRMYCVEKEERDKFTQYLRCFVESGNGEDCLNKTGIDATKIQTCMQETDEQFNITGLYNDKSTWSNGRYPPYLVNADLTSLYGVRGSPTFVINDKVVKVARSAEAIKDAICSAFTEPPEECNRTLREDPESPGLGPVGSGTSPSGDSQCK
ncbi:MAG: hypothetical protein DRP15_01055 [Candidatus Aenigmatarchaeota archaeon]|nr:MAG: hypothetical protein DRP15_01055 [Candidatus Aenigmarchaeota archaeon]